MPALKLHSFARICFVIQRHCSRQAENCVILVDSDLRQGAQNLTDSNPKPGKLAAISSVPEVAAAHLVTASFRR
ncbi:MAG: hypothetical protein ACK58T_03355, partial [Phycisphaerae bacterium]